MRKLININKTQAHLENHSWTNQSMIRIITLKEEKVLALLHHNISKNHKIWEVNQEKRLKLDKVFLREELSQELKTTF